MDTRMLQSIQFKKVGKLVIPCFKLVVKIPYKKIGNNEYEIEIINDKDIYGRTALNIAIKNKNRVIREKEMWHSNLFGLREEKYTFLSLGYNRKE